MHALSRWWEIVGDVPPAELADDERVALAWLEEVAAVQLAQVVGEGAVEEVGLVAIRTLGT